jgi:hypothetical protein
MYADEGVHDLVDGRVVDIDRIRKVVRERVLEVLETGVNSGHTVGDAESRVKWGSSSGGIGVLGGSGEYKEGDELKFENLGSQNRVELDVSGSGGKGREKKTKPLVSGKSGRPRTSDVLDVEFIEAAASKTDGRLDERKRGAKKTVVPGISFGRAGRMGGGPSAPTKKDVDDAVKRVEKSKSEVKKHFVQKESVLKNSNSPIKVTDGSDLIVKKPASTKTDSKTSPVRLRKSDVSSPSKSLVREKQSESNTSTHVWQNVSDLPRPDQVSAQSKKSPSRLRKAVTKTSLPPPPPGMTRRDQEQLSATTSFQFHPVQNIQYHSSNLNPQQNHTNKHSESFKNSIVEHEHFEEGQHINEDSWRPPFDPDETTDDLGQLPPPPIAVKPPPPPPLQDTDNMLADSSLNAQQFHQPKKQSSKNSSTQKQMPPFYNVQVSNNPVFLRRTTIRPPSLVSLAGNKPAWNQGSADGRKINSPIRYFFEFLPNVLISSLNSFRLHTLDLEPRPLI